MPQNLKRTLSTTLILAMILALILIVTTSAEAVGTPYRFVYQVDRAAVPPVTSGDLTLLFQVGDANTIEVVDENGDPILYTYRPESGTVMVTTSAAVIDLRFETENESPQLGLVTKGFLLDNKRWAWSHGFNGTEDLESSIALFNQRNWRGTIFLTGVLVELRPALNFLSQEQITELVSDGWSLGNQTYNDYTCQPIIGSEVTTINRNQQTLTDIIAESTRPDYVPLSFAPPCGLNEYLTPFKNILLEGDSTLQLYEGGGRIPVIVDKNAREQFVAEDKFAFPFDLNEPLGRDSLIELGEIDRSIEQFDWLSTYAGPNRHFWMNTATAGGQEENLEAIISYVYNTYGPAGTDEVWVAPSDVILSYFFTRDNARVVVTAGEINSVPLTGPELQRLEEQSQATSTPTSTPVNTMTPTITATPTATITPLPSITPSPTVTKTPTPTLTPIPDDTPEPTPDVSIVLLVLIGVLIGVGLILLLILIGILVLYLRNGE